MNASLVAKLFGCTEEQARAQYAKNAAQLGQMHGKALAAKTGKHRGFTAAQLAASAGKYASLAKS